MTAPDSAEFMCKWAESYFTLVRVFRGKAMCFIHIYIFYQPLSKALWDSLQWVSPNALFIFSKINNKPQNSWIELWCCEFMIFPSHLAVPAVLLCACVCLHTKACPTVYDGQPTLSQVKIYCIWRMQITFGVQTIDSGGMNRVQAEVVLSCSCIQPNVHHLWNADYLLWTLIMWVGGGTSFSSFLCTEHAFTMNHAYFLNIWENRLCHFSQSPSSEGQGFFRVMWTL